MAGFPSTPEALRADPLAQMPWYYSVELLPGMVTRGAYPDDVPMLPRKMARRVDVAGRHCLDIGSMDGLLPTMLSRRGASRVVASDAIRHCESRLQAVRHYYGVDFEFTEVGLLYDLHAKLAGQSFDFINLSGVLYHVYSPLLVVASVRGLLRRNGLITVSTNIVYDAGHRMEFNSHGRLQTEANTFWYLSVPLFDYLLRMLKLAPVDCLHLDHADVDMPVHVEGMRTGYMSVLCRAHDDVVAAEGDTYMAAVRDHSWEHQALTPWATVGELPRSAITHRDRSPDLVQRPDADAIDLWATVQQQPSHGLATVPQDTHVLHLADES